jgi:hypothetical protein
MEQRKKIIIILISLAIVGVGVFFIFNQRNKKAVDSGISSVDKAKEAEFKNSLEVVAATDKDFDGLSDEEEKQYNTNIDDSDTDGDGLNDWQEIFVYKTNPLEKDTDKDAYVDGYEVRRGFNPNGAGRL